MAKGNPDVGRETQSADWAGMRSLLQHGAMRATLQSVLSEDLTKKLLRPV